MEAAAIVSVLALVQYVFFGVQVGAAHQKHGVKLPSMSGNPEFECVNRVHQNTLEQLVVFIPALWMFAYFINPLWGAGMGVIYLLGRMIFRSAYLKDPASRGPGFMMSFLPSAVMLVWVLVDAVMAYI